MTLTIFSIYDSKAEAYITPFFAINSATGIRDFETAARDKNTKFWSHPGDFTLFEMGSFDQDSGKTELLKTPINHGTALVHQVRAPGLAVVEGTG